MSKCLPKPCKMKIQQQTTAHMSTEKPSKETLEKWHKDPKNWKYGQFYYNKEDQRLLPPKRQEWMGWTVNFANTKSILFLVAIVAVALLISLYFINE